MGLFFFSSFGHNLFEIYIFFSAGFFICTTNSGDCGVVTFPGNVSCEMRQKKRKSASQIRPREIWKCDLVVRARPAVLFYKNKSHLSIGLYIVSSFLFCRVADRYWRWKISRHSSLVSRYIHFPLFFFQRASSSPFSPSSSIGFVTCSPGQTNEKKTVAGASSSPASSSKMLTTLPRVGCCPLPDQISAVRPFFAMLGQSSTFWVLFLLFGWKLLARPRTSSWLVVVAYVDVVIIISLLSDCSPCASLLFHLPATAAATAAAPHHLINSPRTICIQQQTACIAIARRKREINDYMVGDFVRRCLLCDSATRLFMRHSL